MKPTRRAKDTSIARLVGLFFIWKAILLVVTCIAPGPGYDTSTRILLDQRRISYKSITWSETAIEHIVLRLTRWDGIYFASLAERGHVNEQEWAFSWALAHVVHKISNTLFSPAVSVSPFATAALCGILVSHVSHLLAVLTLYRLTQELLPFSGKHKSRIAFTTAGLHIVSPGGIFLSAPNAESPFAFLNFAGMLSYITAVKSTSTFQHNLYTVIAGISFGMATMVRTNGILSGVMFAWDAVLAVSAAARTFSSLAELSRAVSAGIAGLLVFVGFALPQLVAYQEYCLHEAPRSWCDRMPPSIYDWVQDHYWNVGFLRYWTFNNLPLFLLAGPMLAILLWTGISALRRPLSFSQIEEDHRHVDANDLAMARTEGVIRRLALPQVILATLAATSFHVQIINRISCAYPLWYITIASRMRHDVVVDGRQGKSSSRPKNKKRGNEEGDVGASHLPITSLFFQRITRGMVLYAIVQAGLYAAFLPPA